LEDSHFKSLSIISPIIPNSPITHSKKSPIIHKKDSLFLFNNNNYNNINNNGNNNNVHNNNVINK